MDNLFSREKVSKFFDMLENKGDHLEKRYKGCDKDNPDYGISEKEMFVRRTVGKWFRDRYFKIIEDAKTGFGSGYNEITIKRYEYLCTGMISCCLGYSRDIKVVINRAGSAKFFDDIVLTREMCLNMKGETLSKEKYKEIKDLYIVPDEDISNKNIDATAELTRILNEELNK